MIKVGKLVPFLEKFENGHFFYKDGRVWRTKRVDSHKRDVPLLVPEIASVPDKRGYRRVSLNKEIVYEHLLIYAHIYGLDALCKVDCVDHINTNKSDNRIENLEGVSIAENNRRAEKLGLVGRTYGELNGCCKIPADSVNEIRRLYAEGNKQRVIAEMFNISQPTVSDIVTFKRRKYA